jgi:aminodeoxyfutalosine deaminase
MLVYRADWVLPIAAPPAADGWVAVERGRIAGVGSGPKAGAIDLGHVAILPALVNAHTHLELSYLRGAVPPADRFLDWIDAILAARRRLSNPVEPAILQAARAGIEEARASGTGLVGDISNTLVTVPLLRDAAMPARVFYELLGFNAGDPVGRVLEARGHLDRTGGTDADVRVALAPHAPYSVSPGLFSAIREDLDAHPGDVSSVHLGESLEEVEFIDRGTGGWREVLTGLGVWTEAWRAPGVSPVQYLADLGFLDSRVLAVHGVQCDGDDLSRLRTLGTTVVSCPRSNRYVGVGDPPIEAFYAMGVSVAFGTDSLASVQDLNMFEELAAVRRLAPRVSPRHLLESATRCGARALGFGERFGSIEEGKQAALIAIRLPERVDDVEEYLVSGVEPAAIAWLDPATPNSQ